MRLAIDRRYWHRFIPHSKQAHPSVTAMAALRPLPAEPGQAAPSTTPRGLATDTLTASDRANKDQRYLDSTLRAAKDAAHAAYASKKRIAATKNKEHSGSDVDAYRMQVAKAAQERAKAEATIRALLSQVYQGNRANLSATLGQAQKIAYKYRENPEAQVLVEKALNGVIAQTPEQRSLNTRLVAVNQASDKFLGLAGQRKTGQEVSFQSLAAARKNLDQRRKTLVAAVQKDLAGRTQDGRNSAAFGNANSAILKLAPNDSELSAAVQAADVILSVKAASPKGNTAQAQLLGRLTPKSLDPRALASIKADPGIRKVINTYVAQSAEAVTKAYGQDGTQAAAAKLRDVTNADSRPYVTPEMAARVINKLLPTTLHEIVVDMNNGSLRGPHGELLAKNQMNGSMFAQITTNLSAAVESAARGSNTAAHEWDSPDIQRAVEGTGRLLAMNPEFFNYGEHPNSLVPRRVGLDIGNVKDPVWTWDFRSSVAHGYCALALETVKQTHRIKQNDLPTAHNDFGVVTVYDKQRAERTMLGTIAQGLKDQQTQADALKQQLLVDMNPFIAPGATIVPAITTALYHHGEQALWAKNPELAKKVQDDLKKVNQLGLAITRSSFTVKGYQHTLRSVNEWGSVKKARAALKSSYNALAIVGQSSAGQTYLGEHFLRTAYAKSNAAIPGPNHWSPEAWVAINAEYLLSVKGGPIPERLKGAHVGAIPYLGAGILYTSGGLQAAFASTLANASISPAFIKGPFEFGMWGFALKRLITASLSLGRLQPSWTKHVPMTTSMRDWINKAFTLEKGSLRDKLTEPAARDTELVKTIVPILMAAWLTTDVSGTVYSIGKKDWTNATANGAFATADVIMSIKAGKGFYPVLKKLASKAAGKGVTSAAEEAVAAGLAREGLSNAADAVPGLDALALTANLLYLGGSVLSNGIAAYRHNKRNTKYFRQFVDALGLSSDKANILASQNGWSGKAQVAGLVLGYRVLEGDPSQFIPYLNSLSSKQVSSLMTAAGGLADHLDKAGHVQEVQPGSQYLALPANPASAHADPHIVYNSAKKRWEAPGLHMYYSSTGGVDNAPDIVGSDGKVIAHRHQGGWKYDGPSRGSHTPVSYTPTQSGGILVTAGPEGWFAHPEEGITPTSKTGLKNWMFAHGYPLPPKTPPAKPKPVKSPPLPAAPKEPAVYVVREGDNLWDLTGGNPAAVTSLVAENPWLGDPNDLHASDTLVVPSGMKLQGS